MQACIRTINELGKDYDTIILSDEMLDRDTQKRDELTEKVERLRKEIKRLRSSLSFRLGRSAMGPAIFIKRKLMRKKDMESESKQQQ